MILLILFIGFVIFIKIRERVTGIPENKRRKDPTLTGFLSFLDKVKNGISS